MSEATRANPKRLSILTPVLANKGTLEMLPETIDSMEAQVLPPGWAYEWIVMEDGDRPRLENYAWPDSVQYRAIEKQVGEPSSRTLALCLAVGEYALAFDADDTLPAGALHKICTAFDTYPEAQWVAGQEATPRHNRPWENKLDPADTIPAGLCPPDTLYPFWQRTGQFPVTFQCSYKTDMLWKYGGYPAMPYAGDINLLFAVSTNHSGVVLHDTVLNYRRWPGQMTAQKEYFSVEDLSHEHAERWIQQLRNEQDA
jgi:glycosyltransferase involved in cell wall biosynthesis